MMHQHATFTRLELPPVPDLWRGKDQLQDRPLLPGDDSQPGSTAAVEPLSPAPVQPAARPTQAPRRACVFPRPTFGRVAAA